MPEEEIVEVQIELATWAITTLALEAHKRDITLNEYINEVLRKAIKETENDEDNQED